MSKLEIQSKPPNDSSVIMTEIVLPQHTNAMGTIFGGVILSWTDIAAATCALRHSGKQCVTASIDGMHFLAPIKLGWIVTLKASMNFTSHKSGEVGVRITAENPLTREYNHTASAYLTMVALDSNGRPTDMTPVNPETDKERERFESAQQRRVVRLELKEAIQKRLKKEST